MSHVELTYNRSRFTREPIDDGMVPFSRLLKRPLFNIIIIIIERERERVSFREVCNLLVVGGGGEEH